MRFFPAMRCFMLGLPLTLYYATVWFTLFAIFALLCFFFFWRALLAAYARCAEADICGAAVSGDVVNEERGL